MAEAELDISEAVVVLRGPKAEEVLAPLPDGFRLDPELAAARYSRKTRQLVVSSPNTWSGPGGQAPPLVQQAAGSTHAEEPLPVQEPLPAQEPRLVQLVPEPSTTLETSAAPEGGPEPVEEEGEDDDDDDELPPPLEATRNAVAREVGSSTGAAPGSAPAEPDGEAGEGNEAAEALMQKALAARAQKRREGEAARRGADLSSSGGLKKGFLSGGKSSKRSEPPAAANAHEPVTYVAGCGDAEAARRESLKLPEVQAALKEGANKLREDKSWVTPELLNVMQSRPDLLKGLSDPKVQQAMQLMQSDPEEAKRRFGNDAEVTNFLKEFSSLMGTHFDILSKSKETSGPSTSPPRQEAARNSAAPALPAPPQAPGGGDAPPQLLEPEVEKAFRDPEVQALLAEMRAGRPLELHELRCGNPRLFMKMKVLLDAGLLGLQR